MDADFFFVTDKTSGNGVKTRLTLCGLFVFVEMARNDLVMSKIMGTWGELDLRRSLIRLKKCALLKS